MGDEVRYTISIFESTGNNPKMKTTIYISDCGPVDLGKSPTHNWKVEMTQPDTGKTLLETYTRGPIPTDFIEFGSSILQDVHFARTDD